MPMNLTPQERARRAEAARARNFRHGFAVRGKQPPEYQVWRGIKRRCHDPSHKDYPRWGGRGIVMCDRWRDDFEAFYADMGSRPTPQHKIERVDNDGPYTPDNCRWATAKEQAENRRNNVMLEYGGKRMTQAEWARETGIGMSTISYRLAAGWTVADALNIPPNYRRKPNTTPKVRA